MIIYTFKKDLFFITIDSIDEEFSIRKENNNWIAYSINHKVIYHIQSKN